MLRVVICRFLSLHPSPGTRPCHNRLIHPFLDPRRRLLYPASSRFPTLTASCSNAFVLGYPPQHVQESRTVEDASHGFSGGSYFFAGQPGRSVFGRFAGDEDDSGSIPLEALQLAVSLGLRNLATAAAQAVLLRLETVSRSEAFEASGMTKRELVVAALEAARS